MLLEFRQAFRRGNVTVDPSLVAYIRHMPRKPARHGCKPRRAYTQLSLRASSDGLPRGGAGVSLSLADKYQEVLLALEKAGYPVTRSMPPTNKPGASLCEEES